MLIAGCARKAISLYNFDLMYRIWITDLGKQRQYCFRKAYLLYEPGSIQEHKSFGSCAEGVNQIGLSYLMMGKSVLKLCSCGWDTSKARGRRDIWRDGGGTLAARRQSDRDHERSRCFARMISNRQMKIIRMTNMGDVSKQAVESAQLQGQVSSFKDYFFKGLWFESIIDMIWLDTSLICIKKGDFLSSCSPEPCHD